jgi:hypothetical protein
VVGWQVDPLTHIAAWWIVAAERMLADGVNVAVPEYVDVPVPPIAIAIVQGADDDVVNVEEP